MSADDIHTIGDRYWLCSHTFENVYDKCILQLQSAPQLARRLDMEAIIAVLIHIEPQGLCSRQCTNVLPGLVRFPHVAKP